MIRRCAGSSAARRLRVLRPRRARWGASRREWLAAAENLAALADLSGQWIDRVHGRRPPRGIVLDMDSSVSPTHGEQERQRLERPLRLHLLPSAVRVQPVRRSGTLRAASRQRPQRRRLGRRARSRSWPATGARSRASISAPTRPSPIPRSTSSWKPSGSNTRSGCRPTGSCRSRIGYLLKRPVGRPPNEVRRYYASFSYQAGSWTKPRRVVAKVEWHPGELYPARRLHRHQPEPPGRARRRLLQPARHVRAMDQGRQGRDQVDAAVVPLVRRQRGASSASRAGLQSRQLPAHAGDAGADQGLVADQPAGEADQDRREGREPRPLRRLPDGRGRRAAANVRGDLAADRGTAAAAATSAGVRRSRLCIQEQPTEGVRPKCQGKWPDQPLGHVRAARCAGSRRQLASGLQGSWKIATIHVSSGVIWGIPV